MRSKRVRPQDYQIVEPQDGQCWLRHARPEEVGRKDVNIAVGSGQGRYSADIFSVGCCRRKQLPAALTQIPDAESRVSCINPCFSWCRQLRTSAKLDVDARETVKSLRQFNV